MKKLIYSMLTSLDGYTEDEHGTFGWSAPDDPEVHGYVNHLAASLGTYLYGRRMYETMLFWESVQITPEHPSFIRDWARQWQMTEKIVFSRTLSAARSARTRIERAFDPTMVRRLKERADADIAVAGPHLAAEALRAGLVDEIQLVASPVVVGGGTRFFPAGVRLALELLEEHRFASGVVALRYAVRS